MDTSLLGMREKRFKHRVKSREANSTWASRIHAILSRGSQCCTSQVLIMTCNFVEKIYACNFRSVSWGKNSQFCWYVVMYVKRTHWDMLEFGRKKRMKNSRKRNQLVLSSELLMKSFLVFAIIMWLFFNDMPVQIEKLKATSKLDIEMCKEGNFLHREWFPKRLLRHEVAILLVLVRQTNVVGSVPQRGQCCELQWLLEGDICVNFRYEIAVDLNWISPGSLRCHLSIASLFIQVSLKSWVVSWSRTSEINKNLVVTWRGRW